MFGSKAVAREELLLLSATAAEAVDAEAAAVLDAFDELICGGVQLDSPVLIFW